MTDDLRQRIEAVARAIELEIYRQHPRAYPHDDDAWQIWVEGDLFLADLARAAINAWEGR